MAAAYAALNSLTHIINDIQNHHSPPISLDTQQIQSLLEKVSFLQEFLEGYTSPAVDIDDEADPLEMRIADAAYAAEDLIESYITHLTTYPSTTSTTHHQQETTTSSTSGNVYEDLHQVIEEMDLIKKVAVKIEVHDMRQRNISASSDEVSSTISSSGASMVFPNGVVLEIMEKLVGGPPDRHVIPIAGMGGIGKTTLATNIYAQKLIKEHFDICVWATISQQFNTTAILCDLLSQATGKNKKELSERLVEELGLELYKYLFGRRYLIVMDDMWSIDAWDEVQHFFPNNGNGSRILVTTRLIELSSQLNYNYIYEMKFLDESRSWKLFSKTVFGEESCPLELEKIGKEIVENCRGLPLSIVVVGGLLKKLEHSERCWKSIRNNFTSLVNLENDKQCLRLLKMSYNHLPVYLKPCFLYMGVFEEDSTIRVSTLVKLWISEGFLKPMDGKGIETAAKELLMDLIVRNLIIVSRYASTGSIKYIKIHDLMRDLCLRESQKCGFYHVVGEDSPRGLNSQRRVVIEANTSEHKVCDALQSLSHTRSIICQKRQLPQLYHNFGLLRTLCASDNLMSPLAFQCTVNLRYISAMVDSMSSFLFSLNLFSSLQTLIVYCMVGGNAPLEIWKLSQLRYVEFRGESLYVSVPSNEGLDSVVVMENLQTLKGIKNFKFGEGVVKRIPNVKKLKVIYCGNDEDYCLANIKYLCKLESLHVLCDERFSRIIASYEHEFSLPLSLKNLKLEMHCNEFGWDKTLEKIALLPLLEKLELGGGCLGRDKWEVGEFQFPSLKCLSFSRLSGLKHWTTQDSSIFPRLELLELIGMKDLEEIPCEIGYIPTLLSIRLINCGESTVTSAKGIVEEQIELQGEDLPFSVQVVHFGPDKAMESLAGPNFHVFGF